MKLSVNFSVWLSQNMLWVWSFYTYLFLHILGIVYELPCKHAISCQYRACTGPMLAASAQYRRGTGT